MIIGIAACDMRFGVGYLNQLPWPRLKKDMIRFRRLTHGEVVVMGRKTWESMGRRSLKGRLNIVVTSSPDQYKAYEQGGIVFVQYEDLDTYVDVCYREHRNIYIIGGVELWRAFASIMDIFYITRVNRAYPADTFLPYFDIRKALPYVAYSTPIVHDHFGGPTYYFEAWCKDPACLLL